MKKARQVTIPTDGSLTKKDSDEFLQHAFNSSLWQLTNYSRSRHQLREKLHQKGYPKIPVLREDGIKVDFVEETLNKLEESDFLNDERTLKDLIASKKRQGWGNNRIQLILQAKGFEVDSIASILEDGEEDEALNKTFVRYTSSYAFRKEENPYKKRSKVIQHMLSKGFSYDDISVIVDNYFDEANNG